MMKTIMIFLFIALLCSSSIVAQKSSYAGEERRTIKSLSEKEIEQYLSGAGLGLAKAAELNHYPGPTHVLDFADTLELSVKQKNELERIVNEMKSAAVRLGKEIVAKEQILNDVFASGTITIDRLKQLTNEIGSLQAKLRFTHLKAHIAARNLMTQHQIRMYDLLRGYDAEGI